MKVTVDEKLQTFWLAHNDGWKKAVGHGLRIEDYHFCVIPKDGVLNVSEVTTGLLVSEMKLYALDYVVINNKKTFLKYIEDVIVPFLEKHLHRYGDLTERKNDVYEKLGVRPPIEEYRVMNI